MGSDLVIHGTLHCHCIAMHCIEWYMVHDRIDACLSSESKLWNDSKEESTKWIELEDNRQHVLLFYMTKEIFLNFHLFIVTQQSGTVTLFWIHRHLSQSLGETEQNQSREQARQWRCVRGSELVTPHSGCRSRLRLNTSAAGKLRALQTAALLFNVTVSEIMITWSKVTALSPI